jgi:hypothetical protein
MNGERIGSCAFPSELHSDLCSLFRGDGFHPIPDVCDDVYVATQSVQLSEVIMHNAEKLAQLDHRRCLIDVMQ